MKLNVLNFIDVEGSMEELAGYSFILISFLTRQNEHDMKEKAKREAEAIIKAINASIEDLKKQEGESDK